ncbi:MAG: hypothetical protein R3222_01620 [Balneolaceae bacterium]|nr:hypothetical protein [Balneolaceae bacterium]
MSSDSREERERLKEQYKEHYRKMRDAKERLYRSEKTRNISDALKSMDTSQLTETFDEFLFKVKTKLTSVEARLEVAMDSLAEDDLDRMAEAERDEELRKAKAKETLRQAKIEMGLLYNEIEQRAQSLNVEKTIGSKKPGDTGSNTDRPEAGENASVDRSDEKKSSD